MKIWISAESIGLWVTVVCKFVNMNILAHMWLYVQIHCQKRNWSHLSLQRTQEWEAGCGMQTFLSIPSLLSCLKVFWLFTFIKTSRKDRFVSMVENYNDTCSTDLGSVITIPFFLRHLVLMLFLCCVFKGKGWKSLGLLCLKPGC